MKELISAVSAAAGGMLFTYIVGWWRGYRAKRRDDDRNINAVLHRQR